ncbi:MAG: sensor histidine kinase [Bacillota bacterium]
MDRKTAFILNLAKYGGYLAVLWVVFSHSGFIITGPLIPFFFVFATDSIRSNYLDVKMPSLSVPSLYLQMLIVFTFIFLDGTSVGGILLVILIAESLLIYPRPNGERIFFISLIGFPAVSAVGFSWRSTLNWDNMAAVMINCLFFFFAYAFSYMARRQIEEKERAENALEQLERSRAEVENAYHKLIEVSKEREQLIAVEERSRLARELHDTLAHTLTAVIVSLEAGKKLLQKDPQRALMEIGKSQEQARKGLDEVRLTVKALRPGDLDKMDFTAAIKGLARDYSGSDIRMQFELDEIHNLSPSLETTLYRIIQESITNSVRHGEASLIKVCLKRNEDGLLLEVEDDGKGYVELSEGHGLRGIRERAVDLGANVSFDSLKSGGFLVRLTLEGL